MILTPPSERTRRKNSLKKRRRRGRRIILAGNPRPGVAAAGRHQSGRVTSFAQAMELGGRSPDLLLARADALRRSGDDAAADSLLWKLISDHPALRDAYLDLYLASIRRGFEKQAERVVTLWLAADPDSVTAWRIQSLQYQRAEREDAAEAILVRVFNEHPEDAEAIAALGAFYVRRQPRRSFHRAAAGASRAGCGEFRRQRGAGRIAGRRSSCWMRRRASSMTPELPPARTPIFSTRFPACMPASGGNRRARMCFSRRSRPTPRMPPPQMTWDISGPTRPASCSEAEALIRKAVDAEPHNVSFLDSMGWVLYKRGKFAEARDVSRPRHREQGLRQARVPIRSCSIIAATCCTAWAKKTPPPPTGSAPPSASPRWKADADERNEEPARARAGKSSRKLKSRPTRASPTTDRGRAIRAPRKQP